nr:MAG TPA: hypothetical protein [Caudoviricetes sp.]
MHLHAEVGHRASSYYQGLSSQIQVREYLHCRYSLP